MRSGRRDAGRVRALYRASCRAALDIDPESALAGAVEWGRWAASSRHAAEAAEAYEYGLDALDLLTDIQVRRRDKEAWLRSAAGVAVGAAVAHAASGHPARAALALERGRAVVFSEQLERVRVDLARLPDAALVGRFRSARDQLAVRALDAEVARMP